MKIDPKGFADNIRQAAESVQKQVQDVKSSATETAGELKESLPDPLPARADLSEAGKKAAQDTRSMRALASDLLSKKLSAELELKNENQKLKLTGEKDVIGPGYRAALGYEDTTGTKISVQEGKDRNGAYDFALHYEDSLGTKISEKKYDSEGRRITAAEASPLGLTFKNDPSSIQGRILGRDEGQHKSEYSRDAEVLGFKIHKDQSRDGYFHGGSVSAEDPFGNKVSEEVRNLYVNNSGVAISSGDGFHAEVGGKVLGHEKRISVKVGEEGEKDSGEKRSEKLWGGEVKDPVREAVQQVVQGTLLGTQEGATAGWKSGQQGAADRGGQIPEILRGAAYGTVTGGAAGAKDGFEMSIEGRNENEIREQARSDGHREGGVAGYYLETGEQNDRDYREYLEYQSNGGVKSYEQWHAEKYQG